MFHQSFERKTHCNVNIRNSNVWNSLGWMGMYLVCRKSTENIPDAYGEELAGILLLFGLGAGMQTSQLIICFRFKWTLIVSSNQWPDEIMQILWINDKNCLLWLITIEIDYIFTFSEENMILPNANRCHDGWWMIAKIRLLKCSEFFSALLGCWKLVKRDLCSDCRYS